MIGSGLTRGLENPSGQKGFNILWKLLPVLGLVSKPFLLGPTLPESDFSWPDPITTVWRPRRDFVGWLNH